MMSIAQCWSRCLSCHPVHNTNSEIQTLKYKAGRGSVCYKPLSPVHQGHSTKHQVATKVCSGHKYQSSISLRTKDPAPSQRPFTGPAACLPHPLAEQCRSSCLFCGRSHVHNRSNTVCCLHSPVTHGQRDTIRKGHHKTTLIPTRDLLPTVTQSERCKAPSWRPSGLVGTREALQLTPPCAPHEAGA